MSDPLPPRHPTSVNVARLPGTQADEHDEDRRSGEVSRGEGGRFPLEGHVEMDSYLQRQGERQARRDAQHEDNLEELFRISE
mmetsp:Transcript_26688/g.62069  ORF Transcript_26688/g.62069 Transcript_26688/m.62069 type:complete len:82 (+) Transcript_26688:158-403(+)